MRESLLDVEAVLDGYDEVARLYPFVPSLSHWRAWERAAYRRFRLEGSILDLGCGDGQYFRLLWPGVRQAVGIDADAGAVERAMKSEVYQEVHHAHAHELPFGDGSFDAVFANCSLEHMEHLDGVLAEVHRCLAPGGTLLCSVVTEKFLTWAPLPLLMGAAGAEELERRNREAFVAFHQLANPLSVDQWRGRFEAAGFAIEEHIPILPRFNSTLFLLADGTWHLRRPSGGEVGDDLYRAFSANPGFPGAMRLVIEGTLRMETDWRTCSGAVFAARKGS